MALIGKSRRCGIGYLDELSLYAPLAEFQSLWANKRPIGDFLSSL